ncbi:MAG: protein translocase subunit SecF [Hyphomicrobiales bacterium]|nr:protein translocase subunit SecF [Hyphomicrobiales bacterium]
MNIRFKFLRYRRLAFAASGALLVASVLLFSLMGLNYGIDFRGGVMIDIGTKGPADIGALRSQIGSLGLGDVQIQRFGEPDNVLIRVEEQTAQGETAEDSAADLDVVTQIRELLGEEVEYRRVEVVGPKVSGELIQSGTLAILGAMVLVLVYIWFRFEWQFSIGAILALVHDVVVTIGVFSFLRLEFNLSIIAAILTIVGYSLNDTVVIYDRVRENLRKYKKMPLEELLDLSVNQTLSRTLITSVTTLLALASLYIFGGEVIRGFVFAMIWGVFVGTYSSVFIAAPLLLRLGVKRDWSGLENKAAKV